MRILALLASIPLVLSCPSPAAPAKAPAPCKGPRAVGDSINSVRKMCTNDDYKNGKGIAMFTYFAHIFTPLVNPCGLI